MERALRYPLDVGEGPGSVHYLAAIRERASRHHTMEAVEDIVGRLIEADVRPLVRRWG